jgi:F0F1-type ATP synthase assembly protein I
VPKCPSCSSTNIQKREIAVAGGKSKTLGLGVTSSGGVAVGIGRSRTELSKKADFENESIGFLGQFMSIIVGIVFGAVGWVIGSIFDRLFHTDLIAYFIFIPFGVGIVATLLFLLWVNIGSANEDKSKAWICLACGGKFSKPSK